jgi:hypothetical protein
MLSEEGAKDASTRAARDPRGERKIRRDLSSISDARVLWSCENPIEHNCRTCRYDPLSVGITVEWSCACLIR